MKWKPVRWKTRFVPNDCQLNCPANSSLPPSICVSATAFLFNLLLCAQVVIYVVSDHGMLNVDTENKKDTKLIDIDTMVDVNDVTVMLDRGSTSFLYPAPGKEEKVCSLYFLPSILTLCSSCDWQ